jgi:hypothetical protein
MMTKSEKSNINKPKVCSVCGRPYHGWGNQAHPINNGTCCDDCNQLVIARRLADALRRGSD